jgi:acetyl esterase/lipase
MKTGSNDFTVKESITFQGNLKLDVLTPDTKIPAGGFPVVLWIHGGGYSQGSRDWCEVQSEWFASHGFAAIQIDYRLSDRPEENFMNTFNFAMADVESALVWISGHAAEYHLDPGRILIAGESAGAELAMMTGLKSRAMEKKHGVKIIGILDFYGGRLGFMKVWADPVPLFIVHGTEDPLVPYTDAEQIHDDFLAEGGVVEFYSMMGAGHDFREGRFRRESLNNALKFSRKVAGR